MDEQLTTAEYSEQSQSCENNQSNPVIQLNEAQQLFLQEVKQGLRKTSKSLPCKYFYDQTGSELFEEICELDEYYITRTELALLNKIEKQLSQLIGKNAVIIEPGAGAGIKIRQLLTALNTPLTYVPMDISKDFLFYSAKVIQQQFPDMEIIPIQGDFTQPVEWQGTEQHNNRIVFFPGSTIGNFEKLEAIEFLRNMHHLIGEDGALIIGVDLIKDQQILESAYDDNQGVTAKFNKNLLTRINQELSGDFNLDQFSHEARLNHSHQRIEMHLVSDLNQTVTIDQEQFEFQEGESIHTENSHKYSLESFTAMAEAAGFNVIKTWTDEQDFFSIHYLVRK
jgi:L-histidine Nalpha-methyltransferase